MCSVSKIVRLATTLFIISTYLCNPARAQVSEVDFFSATVYGPPCQPEYASRRVLTSAAHKLKQEWQQAGMPGFRNVLAKFVGGKKPWIIRGSDMSASDFYGTHFHYWSQPTIAYENAAVKLVSNALQEKLPSATKPFRVLFVFDSHPTAVRSPSIQSLSRTVECSFDKVSAVPDEPPADVDFGPYMIHLEAKVRRNWSFPQTSVTQRARSVVGFVVLRSGAATKVTLKSRSGNSAYDKAALRAITLGGPFSPLPDGASDEVPIQLTFHYVRDTTPLYSIHLAEPDIIDGF